MPAAWLIKNHFARFVVVEDARNVNKIWDQMFRASLPYGRKGLPVMAICAVDLALWDLIGKVREEPVFNLIGGLSRDEITFYCTGPRRMPIKALGFWGAKVPLPHSHFDGEEGLRKNVDYLTAQREPSDPDYPLMVDCYMSLTVPYAIRLAEACKHLDIYWWEEVLAPDDIEGFRLLKQAHPGLKWTTGEHEYTRFGFRPADRGADHRHRAAGRDVGRGADGAAADRRPASPMTSPSSPHGSGPYSYHFIASQTGTAFCEYVAASPDSRTIRPVFGDLFTGEDVPAGGKITRKSRRRPASAWILLIAISCTNFSRRRSAYFFVKTRRGERRNGGR